MKLRIAVLASIFASSLLAACGGGGVGPTPNPLPSTTPATTYTSQIRFVGVLNGQQTVQSDLRLVQELHPMTSGSPLPIYVVQPPESGIDSSVYGGDVQVVVSPMPSTAPSVTVTQTNTDATILSTPSPAPSQTPQPLPSGVVADVQIKGNNSVQAQSAGTATATIGSPVDQTPTTAVYSLMSIALDCYGGPGGVAGGTLQPYTNHFGWKYDGSTWVADDDVTTADVYIDGPNCVAQNSAETDATIHVPGGDTRLSTDTPFASVTAGQWANDETSFVEPPTLNPDGSMQLLVVGKTRDGAHVFKLWPLHPFLYGAIEVSGNSVDGF